MKNRFDNNMNSEQQNLENERTANQRNERNKNMDNDSIRSDNNNNNNDHDDDKDKVLVGIFETEDEAINVIRRLKDSGYQEDEITVVAKDKDKMEHIDDTTDIDTNSHNAGEKVGTGAAIGGVLGGVAAALPALGLLVIPGIGPLLAAGPIALILGGVVAGGVAGGLVGVLVQLGVTEEDAKEYENYIDQGKILVLVENKEDRRADVQNSFRENNSIVGDRNRQR